MVNTRDSNTGKEGSIVWREQIGKIAQEIGKKLEQCKDKEMDASKFTLIVKEICNKLLKRRGAPRNKKPVYWWTDEVEEKKEKLH